jgi:hypothetical protein
LATPLIVTAGAVFVTGGVVTVRVNVAPLVWDRPTVLESATDTVIEYVPGVADEKSKN